MVITDDSYKCINFINKCYYYNPITNFKLLPIISNTIIKTYSNISSKLNLDIPLCLENKSHKLDEKGNIFWILKKLNQQYPHFLNINTNIRKHFLENNDCLSKKECIEWLDNEDGRELVKNICTIIKQRQLPNKISLVLDKMCLKEFQSI